MLITMAGRTFRYKETIEELVNIDPVVIDLTTEEEARPTAALRGCDFEELQIIVNTLN